MKNFVSNWIVCMLCLLANNAWADSVLNSYFCDFEDTQEVQNWVLNAGNKGISSPNKWYVGTAGSYDFLSSKGLYIATSADTTICSYNTTNNGFIVAYRSMTLTAGTYRLQLDWMFGGNANEAVYVAWIPNRATNSNYGPSVTLPSWITSDYISLSRSSSWQTLTTQFTTDGSLGKLVIVFYYQKGNPTLPAPKIDNIEIQSVDTLCQMPINISLDSSFTTLTWTGDNTGTYDVIIRNTNIDSTYTITNIQDTFCIFPTLLEEGGYDFYVRHSCDSDAHSSWNKYRQFIWYKGQRDIDLFDLTPDNSGAARCYWTGPNDTWTSSYDNYTMHLYDHAGQIDYGYDDFLSLHTIHYVKGETDRNTDDFLPTIPEGEIASIRINGYDWMDNDINHNGKYAACIEYDLPILQNLNERIEIKYACVMYDASHYDEDSQRFRIEILQNGMLVTQNMFVEQKPSLYDSLYWHRIQRTQHYSTIWTDWQSVQFNLQEYIGQTLTLRIYATECSLANGNHYGYAYFTIKSVETSDESYTKTISPVQTKATKSDIPYNILGQPVDDTYRGIVIRNGKKVLQ